MPGPSILGSLASEGPPRGCRREHEQRVALDLAPREGRIARGVERPERRPRLPALEPPAAAVASEAGLLEIQGNLGGVAPHQVEHDVLVYLEDVMRRELDLHRAARGDGTVPPRVLAGPGVG